MFSHTHWRTSKAGTTRRVAFVTNPIAPRPTTAPRNSSPFRSSDSVTTSPRAVDELEHGDLRGEVPGPTAVRGRGAGSHHADVRQGGQVGDRDALALELRTELGVLDAGPNFDPARRAVYVRYCVEPLERDHRAARVGDGA